MRSVVVLLVVLVAGRAHAEPPTMSPVPLGDDAAAESAVGDQGAKPRAKRSYGHMIALVDVLAAAGLAVGLSNISHDEGQGGEILAAASAASLVFMSPLIHGGYGNGRGGGYSFLLRAVAVPIGFGINGYLGATTLAAVVLYDWFALARSYPREGKKSRSKRLDSQPGRTTSSITLVPTILADGPGLVLGGHF